MCVYLLCMVLQELEDLAKQRAQMPDLVVPKGSDLELMLSSAGGSVDPRAHGR